MTDTQILIPRSDYGTVCLRAFTRTHTHIFFTDTFTFIWIIRRLPNIKRASLTIKSSYVSTQVESKRKHAHIIYLCMLLYTKAHIPRMGKSFVSDVTTKRIFLCCSRSNLCSKANIQIIIWFTWLFNGNFYVKRHTVKMPLVFQVKFYWVATASKLSIKLKLSSINFWWKSTNVIFHVPSCKIKSFCPYSSVCIWRCGCKMYTRWIVVNKPLVHRIAYPLRKRRKVPITTIIVTGIKRTKMKKKKQKKTHTSRRRRQLSVRNKNRCKKKRLEKHCDKSKNNNNNNKKWKMQIKKEKSTPSAEQEHEEGKNSESNSNKVEC